MAVKILYISIIMLMGLFPVDILATPKPKTMLAWTTDVRPNASGKNKTGAYFELLTAVFPSSEFELVHTFLPYKRGMHYVKEGLMDLFSICTPMTGFYTAQYPWAQEILGVLYDPNIIANWNGVASLNNRNITLSKEQAILPLLLNLNANLIKAKSKAKSLQLLEKGRADFFIDFSINIQHELENNRNISRAKYSFQPLQTITCYPGFSLSPKGKKLSQIWDKGIARLHNAGRLKVIFQKWQLKYPDYFFTG